MPELPECESIIRTIRPFVWGCEIIGYMYDSAEKNPLKLVDNFQGQKIKHIGRVGKYIIFHLDSGYLVSHLRMTGQWYFTDKSGPVPNSDKHFRWGFTMRGHDGEFSGFLWFKDPRKFGTMQWYESLTDCKALNKLGPDGLRLNNRKVLWQIKDRANKTRKPIKNFLLDQSVIAGCGNIYSCLDPRCQVYMADGTKRPVGKVLAGEEVLSRNPKTGAMEAKKVLSVNALPRNGRDLYRIKPIGSIGALKCTEDHRVFTDRGWVEAQYLDPKKHRVAVPSEVPNYHLEQLIIATSLGDSTIASSDGGSRQSKALRLYQGESQLPYLQFKREALGKLVLTEPSIMPRKEKYKTKNEKPVYQVNTRYRPYFYTVWEISKQRQGITREILSKIDVPGLAYWYMDDGHSSKRPPNRKTYAKLCCEGRSYDEAGLISIRMGELGYDTKVANGHDGPVVRFSHDSTQKLFRDVARFFPEVMRYKLEGKVAPFDPPKYEWEDKFIFLPFNVEKYDFAIKTVWDLEVEDNHNFISDNVLVHNCEALFIAGVDPHTPTKDVTSSQLSDICAALYDMFILSIEVGGTSISDHTGGTYQDFLRVYGRAGQKCYECGTVIGRIKQAGRSTFYCPNCQGVEENEHS